MDKERPQPQTREALFEALYGYPLRLAEQVIELKAVGGALGEEFVAFHQERLTYVDELLKGKSHD